MRRSSTIITMEPYRRGSQGRRDQRSVGVGVAIADYDNDGWPDIYVTNWAESALPQQSRRNLYGRCGKSRSAVGQLVYRSHVGDYDGDGRLDLFVPGYVHFDRDNLPSAAKTEFPTRSAPSAECR